MLCFSRLVSLRCTRDEVRLSITIDVMELRIWDDVGDLVLQSVLDTVISRSRDTQPIVTSVALK